MNILTGRGAARLLPIPIRRLMIDSEEQINRNAQVPYAVERPLGNDLSCWDRKH